MRWTVLWGLVFLPSLASAQLREPDMLPPTPLASRAMIVSASWIELYLPENPYDAAAVTDVGRWTVTSADDADFAAGVHPMLVQHRYWPENAWYNWDPNATNISEINVVYRAFLQLATPLKEGKHYSVATDLVTGGPFAVSYDLGEPSEAIHVNQVAYLADAPKRAYLSMWTGQGTIDFAGASYEIRDQAGHAVATGQVQLDVTADQEPWSKSNVYSIDFSPLTTDGTYRVYVAGVGVSFPFRISATAFNDIGYTVIRGLTIQRDGNHGLDNPAVTHWTRPPAHVDDAIDEATGQRTDLVGGHMDAGDRGKYPENSADVAASLLCALELFPDQVEALGESLQIPESGNGIPDLVDETTYALDFLAKAILNTAKEGALPFYLRPVNSDGSGGFEQGVPPEGKPNRMFYDATQGPNHSETLYAAGALAMACATPEFTKYHADRCDMYKQAALRAFAAFENHLNDTTFWMDAGWYDPWTAGPHPWSDEMLVAAANLYALTGDSKYHDWIMSELPTDFTATKEWGWVPGGPWLVAYLSLYRLPNLDATIKQRAHDAILAYADTTPRLADQPNAAPFGAPMPTPAYAQVGWYYSGYYVAFPMMMAYGISHDTKYRDALVLTWNYLLGANPLSRSFISGLGDPDHRPRWQVHEIAQYQYGQWKRGLGGWSELPPGIPSADVQHGDYEWYYNDTWNTPRKDMKFPDPTTYPALYRYHDSWSTTDEFVIVDISREAASVVPLIAMAPAGGTGGSGGGAGGSGGSSGGNASSGCGCAVGGRPSAVPLLLVLVLAALCRRRP